MRNKFFHSLVFALVTTVSVPSFAASTLTPETPVSEHATKVFAPDHTQKVDLNEADALSLQRELVGVGEAKAKAIVAYRESNGPFASVEELLEVKGIGKAILDKNRERIEVK